MCIRDRWIQSTAVVTDYRDNTYSKTIRKTTLTVNSTIFGQERILLSIMCVTKITTRSVEEWSIAKVGDRYKEDDPLQEDTVKTGGRFTKCCEVKNGDLKSDLRFSCLSK